MKIPEKPSLEVLSEMVKSRYGKTGEAEVSFYWTKKEFTLFTSILGIVALIVERNRSAILSHEVNWYKTFSRTGEVTGYEIGSVELQLDKRKIRSPQTILSVNRNHPVPDELIALAERCSGKAGRSDAEGGISFVRGDEFVLFETSLLSQAAKLIYRNPKAIAQWGVNEEPKDRNGSFSVWFKLHQDQVRRFDRIAVIESGEKSASLLTPRKGRFKKAEKEDKTAHQAFDYDDLE